MEDLVNNLRKSRKNPSVLKTQLLAIRSAKPDILIFIFEGIEDVGVYEEWIEKIPERPAYEPLPGKGKEQLIALYQALRDSEDPLLENLCFFVDCDFDPYIENEDQIFNLNAYSIENLLCCPQSLQSILSDEFQCAGFPMEREEIERRFVRILSEMELACRDLNLLLFIARRLRINVKRKPESSKEIANIDLHKVTPAYDELSKIVELEVEPDRVAAGALENEFKSLSAERSQRGKYLICMFRRWLNALAEDRRSERPELFSKQASLRSDIHSVKLRRLASRVAPPLGLDQFLLRAAENNKGIHN